MASKYEWFSEVFENRYGKTGTKAWREVAVKEVLAFLREYISRHKLPFSIRLKRTGE